MANIIVPVVTIFDHSGKPDYEDNKKAADYLIQNGVDGILVLGSTGEFTELTVRRSGPSWRFTRNASMEGFLCLPEPGAIVFIRPWSCPTPFARWAAERSAKRALSQSAEHSARSKAADPAQM